MSIQVGDFRNFFQGGSGAPFAVLVFTDLALAQVGFLGENGLTLGVYATHHLEEKVAANLLEDVGEHAHGGHEYHIGGDLLK